MNKKAISDIVTTVLIVLLSVVAVVILWSFVSPLLSKSGAQVAQTQACLNANLEITGCTLGGSNLYNVTVKRNSGAATLTGIKLVFAKADGSTTAFNYSVSPGELETKLYSVNAGFAATNVGVAAEVTDSSGNKGYCAASQPFACA